MNPVTITATGGSGTKTFSETGLPPGVSINSSTGVISGTNTTDSYSATVMVTVTDDTGSVSTSFSWFTAPGLIVNNIPNQSSQVNQVIKLPVQFSYTYGGTLVFTATNLPNGLSIDPTTGIISGTIADGDQTSSPYNVQVKATDGTHSATVFIGWTVLKSFVVVNPGTVLFPENLPVSLQMQAVNGNGAVTYTASNLPLSLSINPQTGLISGILADYANSQGNFVQFSVTVSATDSTHKTVSTTFTFETEPGFFLTNVSDQTNRAGDVVDDFLGAFSADDGATVNTALSGLPTGLSYNPTTHLVTGTIDANAYTASPWVVTATFTNVTFNYTYTKTFNWTVTPAILMANPGDQTSVVGATVNLPIVVTKQFGQPITFSTSSLLPKGLSLDPNTGVISGTVSPQVSSSSDFTIDISATDGTADGDVIFHWHVGQAADNVVELFDPTSGGTVTLTSPVGTTLSANIFDDGELFDAADIVNSSIGFIQLTVDGVAPGGAADVLVHSSTFVSASGYYVFSPTPENGSYHTYNFLYQHQTDSDDASTTGAETLSNGDIVLHMVDGARGDADLTADGTISLYAGGPAELDLSAHIVDGAGFWPAGVPMTLNSEVGGSAAPGATLLWQASYTSDFNNFFSLPNGTGSTYTFTPTQPGEYFFTLTATSTDGTITAIDQSYELDVTAATTGTPPISAFDIAGIPTDIVAGHSFTATILADDANFNPLQGYTGPISIKITDPQNNTIYSTSGNFDPSEFTLGPVTLNTRRRIASNRYYYDHRWHAHREPADCCAFAVAVCSNGRFARRHRANAVQHFILGRRRSWRIRFDLLRHGQAHLHRQPRDARHRRRFPNSQWWSGQLPKRRAAQRRHLSFPCGERRSKRRRQLCGGCAGSGRRYDATHQQRFAVAELREHEQL